MAIVSILHRITGVLLFLFLPIFLYLLHASLDSPESFGALHDVLQNMGMRLLLWVMICVTLFHLVAGIRHLMMDLGVGESLHAAHLSAYAVFIISVVLFILVGVWLW